MSSRSVKALAVATALGTVFGVAGTSDAAGATPNDSVVGAGTTLGNPGFVDYLHFTVSVQSGPNGENPDGNIVYRFLDDSSDPGGKPRSADIVCLRVEGNAAVVIAEWKKGDRPFGDAYPYLALVVRDNGSPGSGGMDLGFASATSVPSCGQIWDWVDLYSVPLVTGNVVVRDAVL
jgi:hypothetical protein